MKSARSCIMANRQNFAFLQIEVCKNQGLISYHPLCARCKVQDQTHLHKCKILHSCTSKMCKYQDILFYHPLYTRCKAKDLAHSHTCKILYSCTCASTKTLCFHPPLNARCKVQDLAHLQIFKILHLCTLEYKRIKTLLILHPYVQCNILHICTRARFYIAHQNCASTKIFCFCALQAR